MNSRCLAIQSYICKEIRNNIVKLQDIRNTEVNILNYNSLSQTCRDIDNIVSELHVLNFDLLNLSIKQNNYADKHEIIDKIPDVKLNKDQFVDTYIICSTVIKKYWYVKDISYYDVVNKMVSDSIKEIQLTEDYFFSKIRGKIDKKIRMEKGIYLDSETKCKLDAMQNIDRHKNMKELYKEKGGPYKIMEISFDNTYSNVYNNQLQKYDNIK